MTDRDSDSRDDEAEDASNEEANQYGGGSGDIDAVEQTKRREEDGAGDENPADDEDAADERGADEG